MIQCISIKLSACKNIILDKHEKSIDGVIRIENQFKTSGYRNHHLYNHVGACKQARGHKPVAGLS